MPVTTTMLVIPTFVKGTTSSPPGKLPEIHTFVDVYHSVAKYLSNQTCLSKLI